MKSFNKKKKVDGIVFDLGGVLVGDFSRIFFETVSKEFGVSPRKIERVIRREIALLEQGKETSIDFWYQICNKLKIACPKSKVLSSLWVTLYRQNAKINKATLSLVKRLRDAYSLGLISNTIEEHTRINRKRKLFQYFDAVLLSHEVGLRKPQKEIFLLASKKLNIPVERLLFIDDELRFVEAARKAGLKSIFYKSPDQLKKRLTELGILF